MTYPRQSQSGEPAPAHEEPQPAFAGTMAPVAHYGEGSLGAYDLGKSYGGRQVVREASLAVRRGEAQGVSELVRGALPHHRRERQHRAADLGADAEHLSVMDSVQTPVKWRCRHFFASDGLVQSTHRHNPLSLFRLTSVDSCIEHKS